MHLFDQLIHYSYIFLHRHSNVRSVYLEAGQKPYVKHLRSTHKHKSAGSTFALNQKNNDMCNLIFS